MTDPSFLEHLSETFYDLVMKKSTQVTLKSICCYLELSPYGKELTVLTRLRNCSGIDRQLFFKNQSYFKVSNTYWDSKKDELVIAKKFDFSSMSPQSFALKVAQFHKEIICCRQKIDEISNFENGSYALNCST